MNDVTTIDETTRRSVDAELEKRVEEQAEIDRLKKRKPRGKATRQGLEDEIFALQCDLARAERYIAHLEQQEEEE